jgi:multidrug efflux system membrane fusion protein
MKESRLLHFSSAVLIFLLCLACGKGEQAQTGYPEVTVHMAQAVKKDVPVEITTVGTVEAYRSITVAPLVTGQIQDISFREGQDVKKGDLLFTIEPSSFREELRKAEATLAKEQAQLKNYEAEAARYDFLMEKGAVSKSEYDKNKTSAAVQEAFVASCKAAVEDAKLKLTYCSVRAPIDGRAGAYQVNKGTVVTANSTSLVSLNQMVPVYVKFTVPEKWFPEIKKYNATGSLAVKASLSGYSEREKDGKLEFIDNTVDPETGVIRLKALFPNTDRFLWPGQFVNVSLWLTIEQGAVVVPAAAVQLAQDSKYVFVVGADKTVRRSPVVVDRLYGKEAVIAGGVKAGDLVVTDGHFKLREGFKVVAAQDSKKSR